MEAAGHETMSYKPRIWQDVCALHSLFHYVEHTFRCIPHYMKHIPIKFI